MKTHKQTQFKSKLQFEKRYHHKLQKDNYQPQSLVLVRNSCLEAMVTKFKTEPRYLGPYEVVRCTTRGNYTLQELDGAEHAEQYAAFCIIPYVTCTDPQVHKLLQLSNGDSDDESDGELQDDIYQSIAMMMQLTWMSRKTMKITTLHTIRMLSLIQTLNIHIQDCPQ